MNFDPDKKILIAMASGNQMNIRMKAGEMSFREFGQFCSRPQKGSKHEAYFTRGVPELESEYESGSGKVYYDGRFRHDSSIKKADFLIIDADNSECSPVFAHEQLKKMIVTHFIYTTHSHAKDANNFRCVIPCNVGSKDGMSTTAKAIIEDMEGIKYVKEMGTWSQAWFLPTRDDPDDGLFEHYEYYKKAMSRKTLSMMTTYLLIAMLSLVIVVILMIQHVI